MNTLKNRKLVNGIGYGFLTVISWGVLNVTTHDALSRGFLPNDLTMLRYCVAAIICLPLMAISFRHTIHRSHWLRAAVFALLAGPLYGWLVNKGMQLTPLSYASVMVPTFTMITTVLLLSTQGEKINKAQVIGIFVIVCGLYLLTNHSLNVTPHSHLGVVSFFLAGLAWSLFTILLRRWKVELVSTIFMMNIVSGCIYFPFYLYNAHSDLSSQPMTLWLTQTFVQSVLASIIVVFTFARTVRYLGATVSSTLPALIPLVSISIASLWFGQQITNSEKLALTTITFGFVICTLSKHIPKTKTENAKYQ